MAKLVDLTGQRFGRLVVLGRDARNQNRAKVYWICRCDCGAEKSISGADLRNGRTQSCGCLRRDWITNHNMTHGNSNTRLYNIWCAMRQRCANKKSKSYKNYGGRGIAVCKEWNEYSAFAKWATQSGYSDDLTIDRIDVDGDYSPDNCRWANRTTQMNNTRRNVRVSYRGETKTLPMWCRELGLNYHTVFYRLHELGWDAEKAFLK